MTESEYHPNICDKCGQETTHSEDETCLRCGNQNPPDNYPTISTDDYKTMTDSIDAHVKQCIEDCQVLVTNKKRHPWNDVMHTFKLITRIIDIDRLAEKIINEQKETDYN